MNVNHVELEDKRPDNLLKAVFDKQLSVMGKYHEIEKNNGLLQTDKMPFDLHDRFCQARIKDFLWRTTEEIAEALEVALWPSEEFGEDHITEELIDALHFHTENCIQCNITAQDILDWVPECNSLQDMVTFVCDDEGTNENRFLIMVTSLGLAGNCLKNKPWKQDHKLTDIDKFRDHMMCSYYRLISLLAINYRMSAEDIYDMYFKKNEVNKFRQRSGY